MFRLLLLILAVCFPVSAFAGAAGCVRATGVTTVPTVYLTLPSQISVNYTLAIGSELASSADVAGMPDHGLSVTCPVQVPIPYGFQVDASRGTVSGDVTVFPTGTSGTAFEIIQTTGALAGPWPNNPYASYTYPYNASGLITLVSGSVQHITLLKTGRIADNAVIKSGPLGDVMMDDVIYEHVYLNNDVTIVDPACTVSTTSITVNLPSVDASLMLATGSITGSTGFQINLSCSAGAPIMIRFDSNGVDSGIAGVLLPVSGSATGVGIQMTDDGGNPVTLGDYAPAGTTTDGTVSLNYSARYYRTGKITPGGLSSSATFTITYE
ncbi:fimbrial protein [Acetobacter sp. AN02]|uniref:fimbrial protein n=1 Tax=Acetobacter sp. AN02 TaxID=2894186 RepID=UPI0024343664|nr:fimbrial protein [Acetobacter sp. AN02]MDG6093549.1 fimbrial protein [Acetobacter sp. AN02]